MKYACWFPLSIDYLLDHDTPGSSNSTIYTVITDSAEDAARAFLSAHGQTFGKVIVCWSFTDPDKRATIWIKENASIYGLQKVGGKE